MTTTTTLLARDGETTIEIVDHKDGWVKIRYVQPIITDTLGEWYSLDLLARAGWKAEAPAKGTMTR